MTIELPKDATIENARRIIFALPRSQRVVLKKIIDTFPENTSPENDLVSPVNQPPAIEAQRRVGSRPIRGPVEHVLKPGVNAKYLEGEMVKDEKTNPTALAKTLGIRPAKFVLTGHPWDGKTFGTIGYRTILHAFTANGYGVDIGDGWGQYKKEKIKPYAKFDVRRMIVKK